MGCFREVVDRSASFIDQLFHAAGRGAARCEPLDGRAEWEIRQFMRIIEAGNERLDELARARREAYRQRYNVPDADLPPNFDPGEHWRPD